MRWFFKKATRDEKIQKRVQTVYVELTSKIECEFTGLETVMIINEVRSMLAKSLEIQMQDCLNTTIGQNGKLKEIQIAKDYLK